MVIRRTVNKKYQKRDRLNEPLVVQLSEQVLETKKQYPKMTCDEIGVKFGVSGATIRYCLLRHGYKLERSKVPRCPACGTFMSKTAEGWVCKTCPKRLQQAHERASLVITSWFGEKGRLTYDPVLDRVQCHICGRWFSKLEAHVWPKHGLLADEYREEFGLSRRTPLASFGFREMKRQETIQRIKEGKMPFPFDLEFHTGSHTNSKRQLFRTANEKRIQRLRFIIEFISKAENQIIRLMNLTESIAERKVLDEARKGLRRWLDEIKRLEKHDNNCPIG